MSFDPDPTASTERNLNNLRRAPERRWLSRETAPEKEQDEERPAPRYSQHTEPGRAADGATPPDSYVMSYPECHAVQYVSSLFQYCHPIDDTLGRSIHVPRTPVGRCSICILYETLERGSWW